MPYDDNSVPLDLDTGNTIYKGVEMTYRDLIDLWDSESEAIQDEAEKLRDYSLDNQVLWGSKKDRFRDNWWGRKRPLKKRRGYPKDLGY